MCVQASSKAHGKRAKKEEEGSDDDKPLAAPKGKSKVKDDGSDDDDKPLASKAKPKAKGKAVSLCGVTLISSSNVKSTFR